MANMILHAARSGRFPPPGPLWEQIVTASLSASKAAATMLLASLAAASVRGGAECAAAVAALVARATRSIRNLERALKDPAESVDPEEQLERDDIVRGAFEIAARKNSAQCHAM